MLPSIQSRISAKDLITCPEIAARFLCSTAYILQLVRQGKLPQPIRRLGSGARTAYIWETRVVDAWLATVTWTDLDGNTETGPFWKLRAKAIARGVTVPTCDVSGLPEVDEAGRELHEPPTLIGDFDEKTGLPNFNILAARRDQLGHAQFLPVRRIDEYGNDRGVKALGDHADDARAEYGLSEPTGAALDPSEPSKEKAGRP